MLHGVGNPRRIDGKEGAAGSIPAGAPPRDGRSGRVLYPACRIPESCKPPFARELPVRFVRCASVRAACPCHSEATIASPPHGSRRTLSSTQCSCLGAPPGDRRRRPGQDRAVGGAVGGDHQRQCVQSGVDPQRRRLQAGGRVAQAWDSIARRRGERRCGRPGWSHRRRSPAAARSSRTRPWWPRIWATRGQPARAVTSTARSMLAPPAGCQRANGRRPAEMNRDVGITKGHGLAPVRARLTGQSDSRMRPASSSTEFRTPTAVLVGDMRVAPAVGRGRDGPAACYPLAPSSTWSPVSSTAASWAACPAATRSGIIGPSPEGSMMPASSQV